MFCVEIHAMCMWVLLKNWHLSEGFFWRLGLVNSLDLVWYIQFWLLHQNGVTKGHMTILCLACYSWQTLQQNIEVNGSLFYQGRLSMVIWFRIAILFMFAGFLQVWPNKIPDFYPNPFFHTFLNLGIHW